VFGYSLTGLTKEQVMFFFWGTTKTGKTTTVDTVNWVMGDYARRTPSETFLMRKYQSHNDLARLVGARMVVAVELEKGEKLASAAIKDMTGGDKVAARFLYKENFEFYPAFKIFLIANDKPLIRGEDNAMWERVKVIPLNNYIPPPARDKDIREKLREEGPGILAWMVQGCLDWQRERDLLEPVEVTEQTARYREEMDILGDFLDDRCDTGAGEKVSVSDMHNEYEKWCKEQDEEPLSKRAFNRELSSRNFYTKRGSGGKKIWHGITLKSDVSDASIPLSETSPYKDKQE
jgi:putative DNA primase/helicase